MYKNVEINMNGSCRVRTALWILVLAIGLQQAGNADTRQESGHITYRIEEGVYVDIGSSRGLVQGTKGQLVLEDGRALVFEVIQAAGSSALLRLDGQAASLVGALEVQPVKLVFETNGKDAEPEASVSTKTGNGTVKETAPFVPLLAPAKQAPVITQSSSVSHGNIGVSHSLQTGTDNGQDRMVTRISTSGNIERWFGSGWSVNWSANARYRSGDGYMDHPEYETIQPLVYSAMMQHPLAGDGFVRIGRFLPYELPGVGYLDGAQIETDSGGLWRWGVMAGLKPDPVKLEITADEPAVVGYATLEAGSRRSTYYSGTAGLLASLYQGEANRLALLWDQRANLGTRFNLFSTAQIDFGIADTTNSTSQLSRFDLTASYRLLQDHTLRAGADHWQRTDTPAERDRFEFIDDTLFDDGYWRYWVGGRHRLPLKLSLNEEVAYTISDASDDAVRWRVGLTRTGLFDWQTANLAATLYNLEAMGSDGMGWLLSAYLPFVDGRYAVRPAASMRWLDPDTGGDGFTVSYYALYLDARINKSWLVTGGITQTLGDSADATTFDLSLRYSW